MAKVEKHHIYALFAVKDYIELYRTQKPTVDLMLGIKNLLAFDNFLEDEYSYEDIRYREMKFSEEQNSKKLQKKFNLFEEVIQYLTGE